MEQNTVFVKGTIGTATVFATAGVSFMSALEQWLRVGSLLIGLIVGVLTLRALLKKNP